MKKSASSTFPYKTGENGYNRQSGRKTLLFVGICVTLVVLFSITAILLITKSG